MHVGAVEIHLYMPDVHSLKEKRARLRPLLAGIRSKFGAGAAEVAEQDSHARAVLGAVAVSGGHAHLQSMLEEIERYVHAHAQAEWVDCQTIFY